MALDLGSFPHPVTVLKGGLIEGLLYFPLPLVVTDTVRGSSPTWNLKPQTLNAKPVGPRVQGIFGPGFRPYPPPTKPGSPHAVDTKDPMALSTLYPDKLWEFSLLWLCMVLGVAAEDCSLCRYRFGFHGFQHRLRPCKGKGDQVCSGLNPKPQAGFTVRGP